MRECLDVAICDQVADLVQAERMAIQQAKPPLNLTLWQNGQKDLIQLLRAVCKAEAKTVWAKFNP